MKAKIFFQYLTTLFWVFIFSIFWEFGVEDFLPGFMSLHAEPAVDESYYTHWEYVVTVTTICGFALIIPMVMNYRQSKKHIQAEQKQKQLQYEYDEALKNILNCFVTVCRECRKICLALDSDGKQVNNWVKIEEIVLQRQDLELREGCCPDCLEKKK